MIKRTTCLTEQDWQNLHGNDLYVSMLRNKVKCDVKKDSADTDIFDYIKEVPEFLVYYQAENVYGHITLYVYFESPTDMDNFIHFYNSNAGIKKIEKT
tara:strand:+ start:152 stop:445 length:294 start_codon:yes stop_codon:yes gene_type:complete